MAQAARLNLRMQKELKLLITDPSPGASFPSLSSSTSLSSIDAQIEGPEGSVYEKGIFKLNIQIPERYPFQPPSVTFVTPIYHPNIDTGGRICLDILNLPPKGAWQPSLNISTVVTSIGLLLSEPNPDDGLMHEASREYKYNRQVFDQKARSMTEKHAKVGASKVENVGQDNRTLPNSSIESAEAKGSHTSVPSSQNNFGSHKRLCRVSRKLSLKASESDKRRHDGEVVNEVPTSHLDRQGEIVGLKQDPKETLFRHKRTHKDLEDTRKKISLELLVPAKKKNNDDMISMMPTSSLSQPLILLTDASKSWPLVQPGFSSQQTPTVDKDELVCKSIETRTRKEIKKPLASRQEMGEDDKKLGLAPQQSSNQFSSSGSHETPLWTQSIIHQIEGERDLDVVDRHGSSSSRIKYKKPGLAGWQLSGEQMGRKQSPTDNDTENMAPNVSLPLSLIQKNPISTPAVSGAGDCYISSAHITTTHKISGVEPRKTSSRVESNDITNIGLQLAMQSDYPLSPANMQNDICNDKNQQPKEYDERFAAGIKNQEQAYPSPDVVIVSDSEDSGEEQGRTTRSKLSILRRHLLGKK